MVYLLEWRWIYGMYIKKRKLKIKEPINAMTHFIAFLAVIPISFIFLIKSNEKMSILYSISFFIFGISLLLLYGASTIYHALDTSKRTTKLLRRIDHMMIFILIAGTYTPVCLIPLYEKGGMVLLTGVWIFAVVGILSKIFWLTAPRWLSTLLYIIMGWLVMIVFVPLKNAIPISGIIFLLSGGIVYTVGAIIYALKPPKLNFKLFGFHEIFHLFVILGSVLHIIFMFKYIL